jgi:hypothetical protein
LSLEPLVQPEAGGDHTQDQDYETLFGCHWYAFCLDDEKQNHPGGKRDSECKLTRAVRKVFDPLVNSDLVRSLSLPSVPSHTPAKGGHAGDNCASSKHEAVRGSQPDARQQYAEQCGRYRNDSLELHHEMTKSGRSRSVDR